jgi:hypothetical protein
MGTVPFSLQHVSPTLAEQCRSSVWDRVAPGPVAGPVRRRPAGVFEPAAGLAITLAGGAFMAMLAVPAYLAAMIAAKADPELRHGIPQYMLREDAFADD